MNYYLRKVNSSNVLDVKKERKKYTNLRKCAQFNPSSPKGGCNNPPNSFRPGAQKRAAKG